MAVMLHQLAYVYIPVYMGTYMYKVCAIFNGEKETSDEMAYYDRVSVGVRKLDHFPLHVASVVKQKF